MTPWILFALIMGPVLIPLVRESVITWNQERSNHVQANR